MKGCQCSIESNCSQAPHMYADSICNCDTMYSNSVDEGVLSSKSALPVMKLSYGGSFSKYSSILYFIGPLICTGRIISFIIIKLLCAEDNAENNF